MKKLTLGLRAAIADPRIGFDLLRIYLGIALFVRGALFIADPSRVMVFAQRSGDWFWPLLVGHYVGMAHLCGGILLAIGAATRIASLVQVPVLVGAVFFVHWGEGLLSSSQSLELASLVLAMLLSFGVFGAGPLSVDAHLLSKRASTDDGGTPKEPESARLPAGTSAGHGEPAHVHG